MKLDSYTDADVFDTLHDEWNALLDRSTTQTPFSTLQWHENWWAAYHPGQLWVLTLRDDDNLLRGIASFFIAETDGERVLHFVGCEDVTDYLDFIVDEAHTDAVYTAFADALINAHGDQFDAIDLCNIPQDSPTLKYLPDSLEGHGYVVETCVQDVCPVITLPDTFDAYLDQLDKKQRKEIQRKLRMADGLSDSIEWYLVQDDHDLSAELDTFLNLMAASHPEKAKFLDDEQHRTFFKKIVPAAYKAGWLQLYIMRVAAKPAAAYLNFEYNNKILVYNSGLDPRNAGRMSPGIILLSYTIQSAIDAGRDEFDFLRGDEQYKYLMGGEDTQIFNLKAHRQSQDSEDQS